MCAATDDSISNLKSPDCSLSFSYLPSWVKKSFKLAGLHPPPFFFWKYLLSLCLFSPPLLFSFLFLSAKGSTQKTHNYLPVFIHQNGMVIFLLLFFVINKESE